MKRKRDFVAEGLLCPPRLLKPMVLHTARPRRITPLICPKGYGLCWGCETWCDLPPAQNCPDE